MKREEIIKIINEFNRGRFPMISSTGLISRELFCHRNHDLNFYMVGSMGLASSMGLGLAVNIKSQVLIIEGDASLLMNLGSLPNIGFHQPNNLIHIVLDNNAYASCSEEPSISKVVKLEKLALSSGYKHVFRVRNIKSLKKILEKSLTQKSAVFILVEMELGGRRDLPRLLNLPQIAERFRRKIGKNNY